MCARRVLSPHPLLSPTSHTWSPVFSQKNRVKGDRLVPTAVTLPASPTESERDGSKAGGGGFSFLPKAFSRLRSRLR